MRTTKYITVLSFLYFLGGCNGGGGGGASGITTGGIAITPGFLDLVSPKTTLGTNPKPIISVRGVASGSTVKLFTDSACTNEVGSAIASSDTVNVTVSNPLEVGQHTFYANSSSGSLVSDCSSASVDYILGHVSVSVAELNNTHRDNFTDCGANQGTVAEKIINCAVTNLGSTVAVNETEGKVWQLVSKVGGHLVWKDLKTGLIWSSKLGQATWCVAAGDANENDGKCKEVPLQPSFPDAQSFCDEMDASDFSALNELGQYAFSTHSWSRVSATVLGENWLTGSYGDSKGRMGFVASDENPSVVWKLPSKSDFDTARVNGFTDVVKAGSSNFKIWSSTIKSGEENFAYHYREPNISPFTTDRQTSLDVHCVAVDDTP